MCNWNENSEKILINDTVLIMNKRVFQFASYRRRPVICAIISVLAVTACITGTKNSKEIPINEISYGWLLKLSFSILAKRRSEFAMFPFLSWFGRRGYRIRSVIIGHPEIIAHEAVHTKTPLTWPLRKLCIFIKATFRISCAHNIT